jgi:hypothetical protein
MYLVYIQVGIGPFKVVLAVFVGPTKQIQSLYIMWSHIHILFCFLSPATKLSFIISAFLHNSCAQIEIFSSFVEYIHTHLNVVPYDGPTIDPAQPFKFDITWLLFHSLWAVGFFVK